MSLPLVHFRSGVVYVPRSDKQNMGKHSRIFGQVTSSPATTTATKVDCQTQDPKDHLTAENRCNGFKHYPLPVGQANGAHAQRPDTAPRRRSIRCVGIELPPRMLADVRALVLERPCVRHRHPVLKAFLRQPRSAIGQI